MSRQGAFEPGLFRLNSRCAATVARVAKFGMVVSAAAIIAGCGGMKPQMMAVMMEAPPPPPPPVAAPPPPPMPEVIMPRPGLVARERLALANNLLNQGDAPHAEAELKAYLAEVPGSNQAKNLLAQIQTPIEQLYPADFFTVMIG